MELFAYNIFKDFILRHDYKYRCIDTYNKELVRKLNYSEDLAKDSISCYLKEQIKILISWSIAVILILLLTTLVAVLTSKLLLIIPCMAFVALFFIQRKMRYCIAYFNFNCNMLLSLLSMYDQVELEQ